MKFFAMIALLSAVFSTAILAEERVVYTVDGKVYEAYYRAPKPDAPLIFMVHDWDGITEYEEKRVQMLNALGYGVFALDMFGKGVKPVSVDEKKALTGALYKDRALMRKILDEGYNAAKAKGANVSNAIGMGYCFGGTVMLEMARSHNTLKGFAIFHGNLATPQGQDYKLTKAPIMIFHGSADASVSMSEFAGLIQELEQTGIKHEAISYSGAPHAFSVFGSDRYREDADKKSWDRFKGFLKEVL